MANKKVYIIDDDPVSLVLHKATLIKMGVKESAINCFVEPTIALNKISRLIEQDLELPKLILIDYDMPEINGIEFISKTNQLLDLGQKIRFYVVSSHNLEDLSESLNSLYITAAITKPLTQDKLKEAFCSAVI